MVWISYHRRIGSQILMELVSQPNIPMILNVTHYIKETLPVFCHTLESCLVVCPL